MSKTDGRTPLLLTSADEWSLIPKKSRSKSERYIVMIDDIFGLTNFSQSHFDDWTKEFDIMWPSIESGHIFLILTSRSEITAQCQCRLNKHSLMKNIRHFLIDDGQYALQKKEKEKMLKVICHGKFSEKEIEEIVKIKTALGFPQVCTFFASSKEVQKKGLSFFKKPNEYVQKEVDALKESDASAHSDATVLNLLLNLETDILQTRNYVDDNKYSTKYATPQEQAAAYGSTESLDILLEYSQDISKRFRVVAANTFLLHRAAQHGNDKCADFLLVKGFQVDLKDNDGNTPLHLAVQNSHLECVKILLQHKAPVNQENREGLVPLSVIEIVNREIVTALVVAESILNQMDGKGRTILHKAVLCNDLETVKFLCSKEADVNILSQCGSQTRSVVHLACEYADIEILKHLCISGARIEAVDADKRPIVHMTACSRVDALEKLTFLIDVKKHLPDAEDKDGRTAIFSAIDTHVDTYGVEILEFLLNRRVSVNHKGASKDNILICLLKTPFTHDSIMKMVDLVVKMGVDLNETDVCGRTALHHAIEDVNYNAAELILKHGNTDRDFDPNRRDEFGKTCLHYATEQSESELWDRYDIPDPESYSYSQYCYLLRPCMFYYARENYALTKMLLEQDVNPHPQDITGRNPLHYAAGCGKPKTVKLLLEKGVDPNVRDGMGWTPFHMAALHERYMTVSALLDSGIDANIQDNQGMTALHLVVTERGCTLQNLEADFDYTGIFRQGHCKFLKLFLEKGVDPNIPDKLGRTALHYASDHSENSSVKVLLDHGADPDVQDLWGMTSLHCASSKKGSVFKDTLPLLLEKSLKLNVQDSRGKTTLHYASEIRCSGLKLLLDHGADPCLRDQQGMTALHCASPKHRCNMEAFQMLLKSGVDPNVIDEQGRTALHYASENSDKKSIKLLLDRGADPSVQDLQGMTSLHCAATNSYGALQTLIDRGVDPNILDKKRRTALHYASERDSEDSVKLLLDRCADPGVQDLQGMSALHCAVHLRHYRSDVLPILLEKGIHPNCLDKQGKTALHYASENSTKECVKLLLEYNADPGVQDIHGMTSLHCAAKAKDNSCDILEILLRKSVGSNIVDKKGRTELHYVSEHSDKESVKLLLDHEADPGVQDIHGMSSLHCAAKAKDNSYDILEILLEKSVDPNLLDKKGRTALHYVSEHSDTESVKLLLDHEADPGVKDIHGMTSLHCAAKARYNSCDILEILLEKSVGPNILDKKGLTALHSVSECDSADSVKFLVDRCADSGVQDLQGMSALNCAVHLHRFRCDVLPILLEKGKYPNLLDKQGRTALHYASEHSNKKSVKLLLDHEADPGVQDLQGMTCLHCAAKNRYSYDILEILLEKNVDPNLLDKKGRTALHYASEHSNKESVKLLLDHKADPGVQDIHGMTTLHFAAKNRYSYGILEILLEKSVDPNVLDKKGRTALHYASENSKKESVKLLLNHEADPDVQDFHGMTSLHCAAKAKDNSCGILEILLEKSVDPNILDKKGRTALLYALEQSPVKNIKPVQHGAYTEVQNLFADIPLHPTADYTRPEDMMHVYNITKPVARRTSIYRCEFEDDYGTLLCEYRRMKMLEMLVMKVNPKIQDHEGRTALHYAAQASRNETLELLLELGVNVHKQNDQDRAFFRAAADRSYNRCERVKLLLRRGVDKTVRDRHGRTAEQYATELSDINP
ncbi:serine/threonine-protein phosphatase 6 regulatory ankyrin repeat subunit C-like [Haliotis rubra]|uniref:serine/threonine-protein phosphatase 6 regulatory ankyrin repeat subunit C-like n=1 Tax=Haliotis rubra TaxID=36100 RepID=UPI001EE57B82|nr:serine/threonine-protein phosphatase 6 regulatory ankyrin repeat subunit C-like [Haliotis rubra]